MDERELIARLQKRDEAAFEELIRQYEKKVYTLCFRMCGNSEDAEEAAQDAFLALWRGIDRFRQESSLSTWIYRLATNACIDTCLLYTAPSPRDGQKSRMPPSP